MFGAKIKIGDGFGRWLVGVATSLKKKEAEMGKRVERSALAPRTEAERSLAAAMGWQGDPWNDQVGDAVAEAVHGVR